MGRSTRRLCPQFMPVAGPPDGGTEITIVGTNLGSSRDDVVSVQIGGTGDSDLVVDCMVTDYDPGVRLVICLYAASILL